MLKMNNLNLNLTSLFMQHTVQTGHRHAEFKYAVICSLIWMDYHTIQAVNFTARIIV